MIKVKCKKCNKYTGQYFDCLVGEEEPFDTCPFRCEHCKTFQTVKFEEMWRL